MSITPYNSDADRIMYRKSLHRKDDSVELDVFEAARYFSGYSDLISDYNDTISVPHNKTDMREQDGRAHYSTGGGRMSLDMPMKSHHNHHQLLQPQHSHILNEKPTKEKKKKTSIVQRQPSSPGGRLASFLNSLFSQSSSKKKKAKSSSSAQSMKDDDESPGWRRRRRSSISHFRSSSAVDSKSSAYYSSSSSGFRTPPPCTTINTPAKYSSFKDSRSYSNHKSHQVTSKNYRDDGGDLKPRDINSDTDLGNRRLNNFGCWLDEKFKHVETNSEKHYKNFNINIQKCASESTEVRKFNDEDDGADSDSSSDLFELQNYDLGYDCSSGLPVYETTCIESIKRGPTIAGAAVAL